MAKRQRTAAERAAESERIRSRPARGRILAAARQLTATRGYEGLKVGELAATAGVSRETFYTHFADKRACIAEAVEPRLGEIEARCRAAQEDGEPWAASLMAAVDHALGDRFGSQATPRGRILAAMLAEVGRRGYAATRLVDVIKAARVSYPAFYRHFANKEECFAAAYASLIERIEGQIEDGKHERASQRLAALAEILAADRAASRTLLIEAGQLPAEPPSTECACASSFAELLGRLLEGTERLRSANRTDQLQVGAILELFRSAAIDDRILALPQAVPGLAGIVPLAGDGTKQRSRVITPLRPRSRGPRSGTAKSLAAAG